MQLRITEQEITYPVTSWPRRLLWAIAILLLFPACSLFSASGLAVTETRSALSAQQTSLVQTQTQIAFQPTWSTGLTLEPSTTSLVLPTATLAEIISTPTPELLYELPEMALERNLKTAKILLFEDMSASRHLRYVKEALDRENYFYLDVGSAKGWFKTQLLSTVDWDLIIAAAEARRDFGGEFFEYLDQRVDQGASLIVEYWDWDAAPNGRAQMLMDRCGVAYESDWYEPDLRVFFWLAPEHPVFYQPNQIASGLHNAAALWRGDLGDLFKLNPYSGRSSGDAQFLAGTNARYKSDHAVLVNCVQGRVILQSFSSHEYDKEQMIALWQNYIYHTLKSRFALAPPYQPTPLSISAATPAVSVTPEGPLPGIGQPAACGASLSAQVSDVPIRQRDLFEHHAAGTFLTLRLELENLGTDSLQIYDQDYFLEGVLDGKPVVYQPHKAATGYLYIQNAGDLYQGLIQPGQKWRTHLAFDISPQAQNLVLVIQPGAEYQQMHCEARISLSAAPAQ